MDGFIGDPGANAGTDPVAIVGADAALCQVVTRRLEALLQAVAADIISEAAAIGNRQQSDRESQSKEASPVLTLEPCRAGVVGEVLKADSERGGADNVRVLLFAALQDRAGWSERELSLPAGDNVSALEVWNQLNLGPWSSSIRVAINQNLVDPQQRVHAGDELAFLPPFTGG